MNDPTTRALRLLSLLQTHRFWTGPQLVEELGVTARTVRRDVDRLRELGYPVDATAGPTGGYRLAKGATLPPLLLDDDEAVAVAVGLRAAAGAAIVGIEDTSLRALTKLEQVLPDRLRRRVKAIHSNVTTMLWDSEISLVDPEALGLLAQACRDHEEVRFEYQAREGAETRRLVEPHQLVTAGRRWYLIAFDLRRHDWRTFRVDRLSQVQLAGARFNERPIPAPSYEDFLSRSMASAFTQVEAELVVHCRASDLVGFAKHSDTTVSALDQHLTRVTLRGDSIGWLLSMLTSLLDRYEVEVVGPPEFLTRVERLRERLARASAPVGRSDPDH